VQESWHLALNRGKGLPLGQKSSRSLTAAGTVSLTYAGGRSRKWFCSSTTREERVLRTCLEPGVRPGRRKNWQHLWKPVPAVGEGECTPRLGRRALSPTPLPRGKEKKGGEEERIPRLTQYSTGKLEAAATTFHRVGVGGVGGGGGGGGGGWPGGPAPTTPPSSSHLKQKSMLTIRRRGEKGGAGLFPSCRRETDPVDLFVTGVAGRSASRKGEGKVCPLSDVTNKEGRQCRSRRRGQRRELFPRSAGLQGEKGLPLFLLAALPRGTTFISFSKRNTNRQGPAVGPDLRVQRRRPRERESVPYC